MNGTMRWLLAGWMLVSFCCVSFAEMRTWTSHAGETVVAQWVEYQDGVVVLATEDGQQIRIRFDDLQAQCQRQIEEGVASMENAKASSESEPPPLLYVGDFDRRNSLNRLGDTGIEHTLKKVDIVSDPVRHGRGALKLTLQREAPDDPKAYRTDFWIRGMSDAFEMGEEYWYGFSTLLPEDFEYDALGELFVQWINPSVRGSPSLAIYLYEDQYQIRKRWGEGNSNHRTLWRGSVSDDLGQWVDWVVRVRWSVRRDGLVEIWKNGERIISDTGPNTDCAGDRAPYFKFGIYKFSWRQSSEEAPSPVTQRTMYIDEIRIGGGGAGYEAVAPPLSAPAQ